MRSAGFESRGHQGHYSVDIAASACASDRGDTHDVSGAELRAEVRFTRIEGWASIMRDAEFEVLSSSKEEKIRCFILFWAVNTEVCSESVAC